MKHRPDDFVDYESYCELRIGALIAMCSAGHDFVDYESHRVLRAYPSSYYHGVC